MPVEATVRTARRRTRAGTVIARVTARKAVRSGVGWGLVFGLYVATQALTYATSYKTIAARRLLAQEFGSNAGIGALVGPARQISTVPGFTAWKCLTVLAITGAVWGLLTGTRLTRGEEDAGRWELLLAGPVTRREAAEQAIVGLGAGAYALFLATAVVVVAVGNSHKVGISPSSGLFFALAIASGAIMFVAVGALAAQLATSRRQAAGLAAALLGVSYALRMVADSINGLAWLRWVTPLGWIEELQPLTKPRPLALVPIIVFTVLVGVLAVQLAGRDLGSAVLGERESTKARLGLLHGSWSLAFRLVRPSLVAWFVSLVAYGLLLGSIAKAGGQAITSSPTLRLVFERLGVSGATAYLGIALLIMAVALNFIAAGQVSAARKEESTGQLDNLLVRPTSRTSWLSGRILLAMSALVLAGIVVGLSTWAGTASEHAGVSISTMLGAGINTVAPGLLLLGIGVLVFGVLPRVVNAAVYAVLAWWFLVELLGGITKLNHWVMDTSALHQMAAAPSVPINWTVNGVMVGLAVILTAAGVTAFTMRDIKGE